jgi:nucleoside-diphosphate-sugar epimerase
MEVRCLLTGVAGFVGSHLAERLLALGHRVIGVDNFATGRQSNMDSFGSHPNFSFHQRSVAEPGLIEELSHLHPGIRVVFHLAAVVSVPYSVSHPEETMAVNHLATLQLLSDARRQGFGVFVFAGSAAEYGTDIRLPLREDYAGADTYRLSPYGESKYLASCEVGSSQAPCGIALRFFNIYGPRQDPSSPYSGVISRFAEMGCRQEPLTIFGDGQQTRDFIYVSDAVDAYLHAAGIDGKTSPNPVPAGIYNVATSVPTSILELANLIREFTGDRQELTFSPERPGDIRHSVADIERLHLESGWTPRISLRDGLRQTLTWVQSSGTIRS